MSEDKQKYITNSDEYSPTNAEAKLIEVLMNPDYVHESVRSKCKIAGVSHQTYYLAITKPGFNSLVQGFRETMLKAEITDLVQCGIKEAKKGSYQHWKVLLEMAGVYVPTSKNQISSPPGESLNIATQLSDQELDAKIKQIIKTD